ncbi:leucine-rich repeat domain-containing protein [Paraliomyxa miuraensis]|uniref:hypothetical protein n=1 Tax=Paraliomyxa miuraensis TaxID=376150 RepID=UPI002256FDB8|nr:hypothetical protein [Paraliomyxa miuraensis]MCX4239617.1 hypothetical protein [Paraliomyxa miuraensis]
MASPFPIIVLGEHLDVSAEHFRPRSHRGPYDMTDVRGLRALPRLRSASFYDVPIDDEGLAFLCEVSTLKNIVLQGTRVSNDGLRQLARLPALTHLRLKDNPQLTDDGVPHLLAISRLQDLQVHETSITATALLPLARLPELSDLCVDDETGTEAELRELSRQMPRCELLVKGWGSLRAGELRS